MFLSGSLLYTGLRRGGHTKEDRGLPETTGQSSPVFCVVSKYVFYFFLGEDCGYLVVAFYESSSVLLPIMNL